MRIPLIGGAYQSRSVIANAQRCINYFPETNPKDSPVPVTHYQRPGLRPLVVPGTPAPARGIWRASNGNGYCVIGANVYAISPTWGLTLLGAISSGRRNPCSFVDNGIDGVLVDGSPKGWTIHLADNAFAEISDPTGLFVGADRVDYIDTFILFNFPGTKNFGSTLSNVIEFDALYIAGKTNWPDNIQGLIVSRHEIILIGELKSEIWYDAGNPLFPFAELPGAYIEHGTVAKYSIASYDISSFWLGQDLQGQGVVWRHRGYQTLRISNHALEVQLRQIAAESTIADAIGYTYQQDGHYFYVLSLPSGDQTWVFDDSTGEWHQRAWQDPRGMLHRDRTNCHAFINGTNVVGDWENGTLYALDPAIYSDTVDGVLAPITCIRTFPHITKAELPGGQPTEWDGKRISYHQFLLDMECGNGPSQLDDLPAQVSLRWSDDRGRSWGNAVLQSSGRPGEFTTSPSWRGLGIARDRVFEISHSIAGSAALNGAWIMAERLRD